MGLDLYAGSLNRYYAGNWLTTVQRVAKELGIPGEVRYAAGAPPWLRAVEAAEAVARFRARLQERWGSRFEYFARPLAWNEGPDAPYATEKPDHDGVFALDVFAAYLERPDLSRPKVLPDLHADRAVLEASERGYYMKHMVAIEAHLFLPGDDPFVIVAEDPLGSERFITSVGTLRSVLEEINDRSWKAPARQLEEWRARGLVSWGATQRVFDQRTQQIVEEPNLVDDKLEHNAQFGLACFLHLCEFAQKHDVPIVVDQ